MGLIDNPNSYVGVPQYINTGVMPRTKNSDEVISEV